MQTMRGPKHQNSKKIQKLQVLKQKSSYTGDLFVALGSFDFLSVFYFICFLSFWIFWTF